MNIVMIGPFGMAPKQTMRRRALPLASALAARGHRVTMLLPPWSNPEAGGTQTEDGGVQIVNLPLRRIGLCKARLVVDADDWEGAGGWNDVERYGAMLQRFFVWQERWGLTHADRVTVASRTLESLAWGIGVPRGRVQYVPNGVDRNSSARNCSTDLAQPTLLLYTRFYEFSLARIANVLAEVARRHSRVRFTIAGTGLFGEEAEFQRLLAGTPAAERTDWLGWVREPELPAIFARATAALYPFDDTLLNRAKCPVKLTELLDAGLPVAAEAVGQIREYIVHGESGLLTTPGDEEALVNAALSLLTDADLSARLGAGARTRMQTQFTWDRLAVDVERVYAP
jgi:glycosyltransferase involved in cell wall biosynthesis